MKAIKPSYSIELIAPNEADCLKWLERIGRRCYKSECRITDKSAPLFIRNILKLDKMDKLKSSISDIVLDALGNADQDPLNPTVDSIMQAVKSMLSDPPHESVIEHSLMTVSFICDRGVSHELVRHRLAAFTQESTRYCNYSKGKFGAEVTTIEPPFWVGDESQDEEWREAMGHAEEHYMSLVEGGASPQEARSVLPNSLKTEVVLSANFREWRHIFRMRASKKAHPQMRELMLPLLQEVKAMKNLGLLFEDIEVPL